MEKTLQFALNEAYEKGLMDFSIDKKPDYEEAKLIALIESLKLRGDDWPQVFIDSVLKSIDNLTYAITAHMMENFADDIETTVEENLESIEEMLTDND